MCVDALHAKYVVQGQRQTGGYACVFPVNDPSIQFACKYMSPLNTPRRDKCWRTCVCVGVCVRVCVGCKAINCFICICIIITTFMDTLIITNLTPNCIQCIFHKQSTHVNVAFSKELDQKDPAIFFMFSILLQHAGIPEGSQLFPLGFLNYLPSRLRIRDWVK